MLTLLFVVIILGSVVTSEAALLIGKCKDKSPQDVCREHQEKGHCNGGRDWFIQMRKNCRKTCKLCHT
ncbi:hypothetical protein Q1695_005433 [Nippostrongylus brasiliensis]|nr:hypothetical protein Q1695_005433 [Nippostrongylus brasiliensis]